MVGIPGLIRDAVNASAFPKAAKDSKGRAANLKLHFKCLVTLQKKSK